MSRSNNRIKSKYTPQEDKDNLFYKFKSEEELVEYYQEYVRKHGTSEYINDQFRKRMDELDLVKYLSS